jgi:ribosomal protein S20
VANERGANRAHRVNENYVATERDPRRVRNQYMRSKSRTGKRNCEPSSTDRFQ